MAKLGDTLKRKLAKHARRARTRVYWTWRNALARARLAKELPAASSLKPQALSLPPIADLNRYERKVCSQHGEDGILEAIFRKIGTTNRYCVEFGVGSGRECNTAYLVREQGWSGLWMDGDPTKARKAMRHRLASGLKSPGLKSQAAGLQIGQEFITADNIVALFARYGVPREFDLLSIDIDGNDYWVWKNLTAYCPRVVIIEYNASVPPAEAKAIAYDPAFVWQKTDYYGASLLALERLGRTLGYRLVACDESGANAFFVKEELAAGSFVRRSVEELYKPATYRSGGGHPPDPSRRMMPV